MNTLNEAGIGTSPQSVVQRTSSDAQQVGCVDIEGALRVLQAILDRVPDDPQGEWERLKEVMDAERDEGHKLFP